ncbi:hypothetical protein D9M69_717720 [compost metagenome]
MQCVTFYTIVRSGDPGVGIVRRTNPDFMSAGKAQTETKAVFELKGAAQIVAFDFGAGKRRHANPKLDVGFDVLAGKLINKHG